MKLVIGSFVLSLLIGTSAIAGSMGRPFVVLDRSCVCLMTSRCLIDWTPHIGRAIELKVNPVLPIPSVSRTIIQDVGTLTELISDIGALDPDRLISGKIVRMLQATERDDKDRAVAVVLTDSGERLYFSREVALVNEESEREFTKALNELLFRPEAPGLRPSFRFHSELISQKLKLVLLFSSGHSGLPLTPARAEFADLIVPQLLGLPASPGTQGFLTVVQASRRTGAKGVSPSDQTLIFQYLPGRR